MPKRKVKQKRKRWWVSRDGYMPDFYNFHHVVEQPEPIITCYVPDETGGSICGKLFRRMFALRLKQGECVEIERPVLVRKDKD